MYLIALTLLLIFALLLACITRSSVDPAAHARAVMRGVIVLAVVVLSGGTTKLLIDLAGNL